MDDNPVPSCGAAVCGNLVCPVRVMVCLLRTIMKTQRMKNQTLLISGLGVLAGGIALYFLRRSKNTKTLTPSLESGSQAQAESKLHRIMHKAKMRR